MRRFTGIDSYLVQNESSKKLTYRDIDVVTNVTNQPSGMSDITVKSKESVTNVTENIITQSGAEIIEIAEKKVNLEGTGVIKSCECYVENIALLMRK